MFDEEYEASIINKYILVSNDMFVKLNTFELSTLAS